MSETLLTSGIACTTILLVTVAAITDLRRRRIPNYLTLPGIAFGLTLYFIDAGWGGLLLSTSGLLIAPCILYFAHGGHRPGMGDMKLAAALGALLGPPLASLAMLLSILFGGVMALLAMSRMDVFIAPLPAWLKLPLKTSSSQTDNDHQDIGAATIPYGVAITLGTLCSLMVCRWTGSENWFFLSKIAEAIR